MDLLQAAAALEAAGPAGALNEPKGSGAGGPRRSGRNAAPSAVEIESLQHQMGTSNADGDGHADSPLGASSHLYTGGGSGALSGADYGDQASSLLGGIGRSRAAELLAAIDAGEYGEYGEGFDDGEDDDGGSYADDYEGDGYDG